MEEQWIVGIALAELFNLADDEIVIAGFVHVLNDAVDPSNCALKTR